MTSRKGEAFHVCKVNSNATSTVDNYTLNHIHDASDYAPGSGGSGCGSCGADSSAADLPALALHRFFRSRNMTQGSSFGPGTFSNWDIRMSLMEANGEHLIQIFDPTEAYGRELVDGRGENGEAVPKTGVFNDFDTEAIREVRLYDASDNFYPSEFVSVELLAASAMAPDSQRV